MSREALLTEIAKKFTGFETLQSQNADGVDFREVAVWELRAALEAAYDQGRNVGRRSV